MFGNRALRHPGAYWHAQAGDAIADKYNVPAIVAFMLGIGAVAATLTAAGYGFTGWAVVGAVVAAVLLMVGVGVVLVEHAREKSAELRDGRPGHNPLA
jgi:hypothetical protein